MKTLITAENIAKESYFNLVQLQRLGPYAGRGDGETRSDTGCSNKYRAHNERNDGAALSHAGCVAVK